MSDVEPALLRPWHEQNIQMKSRRCLGIIIGDPRHTHAHPTKSSTAQAHWLPSGRKYSRARHRQRQTAANNDLHDGYPEVHEGVRHCLAKTPRPLSGTRFRSIQSWFPA
jgi:hypothetical protein